MSRRATIRTAHDEPTHLASAIAPDNTDEIETRVEDGTVVTTIDRETTSGLQATVDDYVVNLEVAIDVLEAAGRTRADDTTARADATIPVDTAGTTSCDHSSQPNRPDHPADAGAASDDNTTNNE
ncbi:KEOPS complex Pcc1-like subunit [Salinadaptatus halalkaliphilus]|uniref:KEOPS complex Pcc1-like subunit n=1 Tax=Salinadaptatus halalkaliphilus TaxID=2419781 RepID=A0A4S3TQA3_9EURY|nr:KEOPS complex subunit Pcc1 [Salinadaptatus halalkaliphilus]THE66559.1 KEOPS complex Pcc1-like subunit [Salinadaptatus halalkaliphilus]